MRWRTFFNVLFIIYCVEAGTFLVMVPWTWAWDRILIDLPGLGACLLCHHAAVRGAVSGFGFMHLVWGLHDLHQLLHRRRRQTDPYPLPPAEAEPSAPPQT